MRTFLASIFCKRTIHEYQNKVYELNTRCNELVRLLGAQRRELNERNAQVGRLEKALRDEVGMCGKYVDEIRVLRGTREALSLSLDKATKELELSKIMNNKVCKERDELAERLQAIQRAKLLSHESIMTALENNNGNRKLTAQELGVSERTLYRRLKEYKLL